MRAGDETWLELGQALLDARRTYTRDEVCLLMASSYRWGYEQRTTEEDAQLVPITWSAAEVIRDLERIAYRKECDERARQPWPTDGEQRRDE